MTQATAPAVVRGGAAQNRSPSIEVAIRAVIAILERARGHARGPEDCVARVVQIPVVRRDAPLRLHTRVQRGAGIRRQDVERRRLDPLGDRPVHRAVEHRLVIRIHAEDETAVDHHAEAVQPPDRGGVVAVEILKLVLLAQVAWVERLEADEQTAEPGGHRLLEQVRREH